MNSAVRNSKGFTLIEVLVAFAVLGLMAGALMMAMHAAPTRLSRAANERTAILAAQSILATVGTARPVIAGEWSGKESGQTWNLVLAPYDAAQLSANDPDHAPYLVTVHTEAGPSWARGAATLTTIRLGSGGAP